MLSRILPVSSILSRKVNNNNYSNLPVKFATWIRAVCENLCGRRNLAVVLLTALANRCWSLGLMFRDWLKLRLKLTTLFSKAHSIQFHYAIHFTNNVRQSQAFNWATEIGIRLVETAKSFHWSKLTKHRKTVGNKAAVRKVCAKREVMRTRSALMSEDTQKKS